MKRWTIAAALVAATLFAAAVSSEFYNLTSPPAFAWHVLLRKGYSIIAFALVGYLLRRALQEHGRRSVTTVCIVGVATYSGAIEIAQAFAGSHEGFAWNAFDVACGAVGGALGAFFTPRLVRARRLH